MSCKVLHTGQNLSISAFHSSAHHFNHSLISSIRSKRNCGRVNLREQYTTGVLGINAIRIPYITQTTFCYILYLLFCLLFLNREQLQPLSSQVPFATLRKVQILFTEFQNYRIIEWDGAYKSIEYNPLLEADLKEGCPIYASNVEALTTFQDNWFYCHTALRRWKILRIHQRMT